MLNNPIIMGGGGSSANPSSLINVVSSSAVSRQSNTQLTVTIPAICQEHRTNKPVEVNLEDIVCLQVLCNQISQPDLVAANTGYCQSIEIVYPFSSYPFFTCSWMTNDTTTYGDGYTIFSKIFWEATLKGNGVEFSFDQTSRKIICTGNPLKFSTSYGYNLYMVLNHPQVK